TFPTFSRRRTPTSSPPSSASTAAPNSHRISGCRWPKATPTRGECGFRVLVQGGKVAGGYRLLPPSAGCATFCRVCHLLQGVPPSAGCATFRLRKPDSGSQDFGFLSISTSPFATLAYAFGATQDPGFGGHATAPGVLTGLPSACRRRLCY